jgi:hypothetical protein
MKSTALPELSEAATGVLRKATDKELAGMLAHAQGKKTAAGDAIALGVLDEQYRREANRPIRPVSA